MSKYLSKVWSASQEVQSQVDPGKSQWASFHFPPSMKLLSAIILLCPGVQIIAGEPHLDVWKVIGFLKSCPEWVAILPYKPLADLHTLDLSESFRGQWYRGPNRRRDEYLHQVAIKSWMTDTLPIVDYDGKMTLRTLSLVVKNEGKTIPEPGLRDLLVAAGLLGPAVADIPQPDYLNLADIRVEDLRISASLLFGPDPAKITSRKLIGRHPKTLQKLVIWEDWTYDDTNVISLGGWEAKRPRFDEEFDYPTMRTADHYNLAYLRVFGQFGRDLIRRKSRREWERFTELKFVMNSVWGARSYCRHEHPLPGIFAHVGVKLLMVRPVDIGEGVYVYGERFDVYHGWDSSNPDIRTRLKYRPVGLYWLRSGRTSKKSL
ncbi:hypothetical protein QBC35DRAFT_454475 [Podospora australis]|uniref:Uncharacterized protein n=1 Tax=Podospora australis TaxID=1536484 RepID=A0AAN6WN50_9PEZI|nr:hypothetical protein QBC35DRAFT_454475 [Podospora australis]